MPYFNDDIFLYFKKEIEEAANNRIKELETEINETKEKQLKLIEDDIHDTLNKAIETELNEINVDFSADMSRIKTANHQLMIKKKHELLDSIIDEVKQKCLEFVKTDQYKDRMNKLIKKINDDFCGENFLFEIKKDDKILENIIKNNYSKNYKLKKVDSIEIGGFIGVCTEKGILTDQTVDNKLENAKIKFYENSKLAVKK